jgi:ABC-type hemin transport system ATPase subunit
MTTLAVSVAAATLLAAAALELRCGEVAAVAGPLTDRGELR